MKKIKIIAIPTLALVVFAALGLAFYQYFPGAFDFLKNEKGSQQLSTQKDDINNATRAIKLGAILPLTGDAALYGNNDRQGIDLAVKLANDNGGIKGRKLSVVYEDNQSEAKVAVNAINKISNANIDVIIDDAMSSITLSMLPIATQKRILLLSTGATNPSLSGSSPYFFRIWNSDLEEGIFAAKAYFNKLRFKKMAVVYVNNDYGNGLKDVFKNKFTSLGGEIAAEYSFDKDSKDFKSMLLKLKQTDLQAIYLIGYSSQTGIIVKQIKELKINTHITGTVAMEDANFLKLAGKAAEGLIYVFPKPSTGIEAQSFQSQFKEMYDSSPGILCDVGYDAANLIIYAYRHGAKSADDIRKIFLGIKNYKGASGEITFDKNGDVHKPMILKTVRDGKFVEYKEEANQ